MDPEPRRRMAEPSPAAPPSETSVSPGVRPCSSSCTVPTGTASVTSDAWNVDTVFPMARRWV